MSGGKSIRKLQIQVIGSYFVVNTQTYGTAVLEKSSLTRAIPSSRIFIPGTKVAIPSFCYETVLLRGHGRVD